MVFIHTSADATSGSSSKAGPKVTLQPLSVVTRLGQAAVLVQLPGANFAAAAAVQDDADAGCALGHLPRALTHGGARRRGGGGGGGGGREDLHSQRQKETKKNLIKAWNFFKSSRTEHLKNYGHSPDISAPRKKRVGHYPLL